MNGGHVDNKGKDDNTLQNVMDKISYAEKNTFINKVCTVQAYSNVH